MHSRDITILIVSCGLVLYTTQLVSVLFMYLLLSLPMHYVHLCVVMVTL